MKKKKSLKVAFWWELSAFFVLPFLAILLIMTWYVFRTVRENTQNQNQVMQSMIVDEMRTELQKYTVVVEMASTDDVVASMDYQTAEPYLLELMALEGGGVWSHFLIANQNGTEQVHTEGKKAHGYSIKREAIFKEPWESGKTYIGAPGVSLSTGRNVMGIGTPVFRKGKKVGVLIGYLNVDAISDILNKYQTTRGSYAFMINADGMISAHPDESVVLAQYFEEPAAVAEAMKAGESGCVISGDKLYTYGSLGIQDISVCVVAPITEAFGVVLGLGVVMLVGVVVLLLVGMIGSSYIAGRVNRLMTWNANVMMELASGNTAAKHNEKLPYRKTKEIRKLMKATAALTEELDKIMQNLGMHSEMLRNTVEETSAHIHEANGRIAGIAEHMNGFAGSIEEMTAETGQIRTASAKNLEFVSSIALYAEEGLEYTRQMKDKAENTKRNVQTSRKETFRILEEMKGKVLESIRESKKTETINELTEQIVEIAESTNLLSLNASIEAARAGAAGKGFSVVAQEIGKLAGSSHKTADAIQEICNTVSGAVEHLSHAAEDVMKYLDGEVMQDYEVFFKASQNYDTDATEISKMMQQFAGHAVRLKESFAAMDRNISAISATMQDNSGDIAENAGYTTEVAGRLADIDAEIQSCNRIAEEMRAQLIAFSKTAEGDTDSGDEWDSER